MKKLRVGIDPDLKKIQSGFVNQNNKWSGDVHDVTDDCLIAVLDYLLLKKKSFLVKNKFGDVEFELSAIDHRKHKEEEE